jgi:hypothetical protein
MKKKIIEKWKERMLHRCLFRFDPFDHIFCLSCSILYFFCSPFITFFPLFAVFYPQLWQKQLEKISTTRFRQNHHQPTTIAIN